MKQADFFDIEGRLARLSGLGDQFEAFSRTVGFEVFRSDRLCCRNSLFLDSRNESRMVADWDEQAVIADLPHDELAFV